MQTTGNLFLKQLSSAVSVEDLSGIWDTLLELMEQSGCDLPLQVCFTYMSS